jgi:hypothetical protein
MEDRDEAMTFAARVIAFNRDLGRRFRRDLGLDALELETIRSGLLSVMDPFAEREAARVSASFYRKYYDDRDARTAIIGINPGRFGAGVTGVPFTDPVKLETVCGIPNDFPKRSELSADFMHAVIAKSGGPERFFSRFYITSVCPLGFTRGGVNLNYYDDPELQRRCGPFIVDCFRQQLDFGVDASRAFCLGRGENARYLTALNRLHGFFREIIVLPHPRWIMQYRRRSRDEYIAHYVEAIID